MGDERVDESKPRLLQTNPPACPHLLGRPLKALVWEIDTDNRLETPWDALDRAYFNGYALWTYLTTPFFMAMPGFSTKEIEPWKEGAESWRGVRVTFPSSIASHCREQDFYFGPDMLLRRHDYHVDWRRVPSRSVRL